LKAFHEILANDFGNHSRALKNGPTDKQELTDKFTF